MVLVGLQLQQVPHAPNPPGVAVGLMLVGVELQAPMAAAVVVGVWKLAARLVLEVGVQLPNWGVGVGVVV
jgi:hypothetical protein